MSGTSVSSPDTHATPVPDTEPISDTLGVTAQPAANATATAQPQAAAQPLAVRSVFVMSLLPASVAILLCGCCLGACYVLSREFRGRIRARRIVTEDTCKSGHPAARSNMPARAASQPASMELPQLSQQ